MRCKILRVIFIREVYLLFCVQQILEEVAFLKIEGRRKRIDLAKRSPVVLLSGNRTVEFKEAVLVNYQPANIYPIVFTYFGSTANRDRFGGENIIHLSFIDIWLHLKTIALLLAIGFRSSRI